MGIKDSFIAELKIEAPKTRTILERIPFEKAQWKPHEKSMTLSGLATHIGEMTGWISMILNTEVLDFAVEKYVPRTFQNKADLIAMYDENVAKALVDLDKTDDSKFAETWTMRQGAMVYFTLPKAEVIRTWAFNHGYHHRGQLSVYLRLLDIPVPGMFGPTADGQ